MPLLWPVGGAAVAGGAPQINLVVMPWSGLALQHLGEAVQQFSRGADLP